MSEPTEHDIRYSRQEDLSYLETWLQDPEDLQYYPWSQGKVG
jgi:hypothetical protein